MSTSGQGSQQQYTHVLCISPDAPTNPVLFWLGNFDPVETRFILNGALGPLKLDLGDTLYAPNLLEDEVVRMRVHASCMLLTCPPCLFSGSVSVARAVKAVQALSRR